MSLKQINVQQSVLNVDAKRAFYNFTTCICCGVESLATGQVGFKTLLASSPHISIAEVPLYPCLSSPISP